LFHSFVLLGQSGLASLARQVRVLPAAARPLAIMRLRVIIPIGLLACFESMAGSTWMASPLPLSFVGGLAELRHVASAMT